MSNFNIKEIQKEKFYQLPKVFFTNPKYTKLSNDAKITWSILRDRLDLSIRNKWVDENGDIFFIYTNENLMEILNLGKNKVVKIKKELESVNLLRQKRLGLNKPNMLYLIKPEVTEDDIYKIQLSAKNKDTNYFSGEYNKDGFIMNMGNAYLPIFIKTETAAKTLHNQLLK